MNRSDEIGQMATVMDNFADSLQNEVVNGMQKLANGDLTFNAEPKDDQDVVRSSLKKVREDLQGLIGNIKMAVEQVASGSQAISGSSADLSRGAATQAASAEEASSSIEQMNANIWQNAENALQTEKMATQAANDAQEGGKAVNLTVTAMKQNADKIMIVEEMASTAEDLSSQSEPLADMVAFFVMDDGRHNLVNAPTSVTSAPTRITVEQEQLSHVDAEGEYEAY